jgi:carbonic anhydrase
MSDIKDLLESNQEWVRDVVETQPEFFAELAQGQSPEYLWIGCSDSRVPPNEIVGRLPGDMFVHRNIANLFKATDLNCQSVLQYAVDFLKVKHIIVCGHYGCGGVQASMGNGDHGVIDSWISSIKDMYTREKEAIESVADDAARFKLMCELNTKEQVINLAHSKTIQRAWQRGQEVAIHGWIFDIGSGVLKDLDVTVHGENDIEALYRFSKP